MKNLRESEPKNWWKNVHEITGMENSQNNLKSLADEVCDGSISMLSEEINSAFVGVSDDMYALTKEDNFTIGNDLSVPDCYIISVKDVEDQLAKLNIRKAPGPDGIPNWILRDLSPILAPPICSILNASFRDGYVPQIWKSANVCPLPKVTPPKKVEKDLRPI